MTDAHWLWHVTLALGGYVVGTATVLLGIILARLDNAPVRRRMP